MNENTAQFLRNLFRKNTAFIQPEPEIILIDHTTAEKPHGDRVNL